MSDCHNAAAGAIVSYQRYHFRVEKAKYLFLYIPQERTDRRFNGKFTAEKKKKTPRGESSEKTGEKTKDGKRCSKREKQNKKHQAF